MIVQFYQIPAHRILPSGQAGKARPVKGLFAQAGIVGTSGLGGELVGSDPFHLHLDPGLPESLDSQFCPGAEALIGGMVGAVLVGLHHRRQEHRQVPGVGGRTHLIVHHRELVVALGKLQHGADEVLAVVAKDPGNAHDEVFRHEFPDCFLSLQLGSAIDIHRRSGRVLGVGLLPRARKYIVGADIYHLAIEFLTNLCNICCAVRIDGIDLCPVFLIFRFLRNS